VNKIQVQCHAQRTRDYAAIGAITALLVLAGALLLAVPARAADAGTAALRQSGRAFAAVARKVSPGVVFVEVEKTVENRLAAGPGGTRGDAFPGDDLLRRFFGIPFGQMAPEERHVVGQGSGFIFSHDGLILTNNHVVGDADKVTVTLEDGRQFDAKIVGTDPHTDVAVIKIDGEDLPDLAMGDSDSLEVGEWVVAVGNPFGLSHTITAGIVSAKGRSSVGIAEYENFIQTDAAINPGNSGGPLVNLEGEVVGMNTAIFSRSGGYMGIGFAIPINMIKAISHQLVTEGKVTRGYLGVVIQDLTPALAKTFTGGEQKGVLVAQVTDDSPAAAAGLKRGDVITALDGKKVERVGDLRNRIALMAPGTTVELGVLRDGHESTISVKIGELPEDQGGALPAEHSTRLPGLTVENLTPDLAAQLGLQGESGVVVTQVEPGSAADRAGIQPGVLIREVNRREVGSVGDVTAALKATSSDENVLLLLQSGPYLRYVVLPKS
jgi:serine protease Do